MKLRTLFWLAATLALPSLLTASTCPSVAGESTDCDFIITIGAGGTPTLATVPGATGYNSGGNIGSLVGIVNNSGAAFTGTVTLKGSFQADGSDGIFDFFNQDGICNIITATYCAGAATGYEGPQTTFSNVLSSNAQYDTATVNIQNVAAGGTTYFSIEGVPSTIAAIGGITVLGGGGGAGPKCPIIQGATNTDCAFILTIGANGSAAITPVANANPYDNITNNGALVGVVNNSGGVFTGSFTLQGSFQKNVPNSGGIFDFSGASSGAPANADDGICNLASSPVCFASDGSTGYEGPLIAFSGITPTSDCNLCANTGTVNITNLSPNATTYFALQGTPAGIAANGGITVVRGGPSAGSGTVCPQFAGYNGTNQDCGFIVTLGAAGMVSVGAGSEGNTLPNSDDASVVGVVNNTGGPFSGSFVLTGRSGFSGIFEFNDFFNGICSFVFAPYCPINAAFEGPLVTFSSVADTGNGLCSRCTGVVTVNNLPAGASTYFSINLTPAEIDAAGGLTVAPPAGLTVPNATLPGGVTGTRYTWNLVALNGTAPYTWSVTGGVLPTGLNMNAAGMISGTPTTAGNFNFTVTATDAGHAMASNNFSITIVIPPAFVVVTRNSGLVGISSDGTTFIPVAPAASGYDLTEDGNGNFVVASGNSLILVTRSEPPSTLANAPMGSQWLSVSIDSQGNFIVGDNAAHAVWRVSPDGTQVTKVANYPVNNPDELEDVTVRVDSHGNYIVAEDNGNSASLFSITPAGHVNTISITGEITPSTVGGLAFDANGNYVISDYSHSELFTVTTVGAASVLANGGDSLCCGALGIARVASTGAYLVALSNSHAIASVPSNGNNITTFASNVTSLPQPMSIIANVAATVIQTAVTISGNTNLGTIPLGGSLSGSLTASGGTPPYTWSAGALPAGVTFSGGTTGGIPTQAGQASFTATVKDIYGSTSSTVVTFSVFGITTTALPNAVTSTYYSQSVSATGSGAFPFNYSATGVPPGLTFSQTGLLSGIATTPGTYRVVVQVSDANGVTSKATISITVTLPPPIMVPAQTLTSGVTGTHYSQSVSAMGGAPPYTWSVAGGAPPTGLTMNAQGVVSGTPTAIGTFTFSARATDVTGGSTTGAITITIAAPPLTLTAAPLPSGVVGVNYPMQLLNASGGVAPYTYALGQGSSLPAGLSLSTAGAITGTPTAAGTTSFTVNATDSNSSSGSVNLQIVVRPFSPDLFLSAGGLTFAMAAGSTATPMPQNVQVQSTVVGTTLSYTAAVAGGTPWLSVSPGGGTTPGAFSVSLNALALNLAASATPYTANITVMCVTPSPCAGNSQTVGVTLSVTTPAPQLTVLNNLLAFTASVVAPQASTQTLNLQNTGGGTVGIASVTSGAGWVTVAGVPGSIPPGPAVPLTVTADPTSLPAGFYRTTITIVSSAGVSVTPVTMFVATNPTMAVEPGGEQFQIAAGGAPGNVNNSFLVDVSSNTAVSWKAAVQPGASWLSVTTPTGSSTAAQPDSVTFMLDPVISAGLAPGAYYGTIRVTAVGVVNSPLDFEVVLNVLGANAPLTPAPGPSGLLFITSGALAPPTQTVQLFSNSAGSIAYQASATTTDGAAWLTVSPAIGSATAAGSTSQVKVNPSALSATGIYFGSVNYAFGSAGVRTVNVALVLLPIPPGASATAQLAPQASSNCTSSLMAPAQVGLVNNFSAPTAWPTPISIQLADNCGNYISNGQIVTTFSNGDPPMALALANSSTGLYSGTWTPRHSASQVSVTAKATAPGLPAATAMLTGAVTPNNAPILTPESTLHIFNPQVGAGLGPGTIVQLYGSNLAAQTTSAPSVPLATNLNGTSVIIGGIPAPLFFVSTGQINAQIPFELTAGQQYQVIVNANGALTTPDTIQLTPVAPGIAALASGAAIAQHADGSLVSETSPAKPGENLVIYTAGLGDTDNPVTTGAGSPSSPLARPLTMPTLTINGENANILFAGLTPGLVGLYQVNFTVPADAPNGDLALVLSQSGTPANSTILPVHN